MKTVQSNAAAGPVKRPTDNATLILSSMLLLSLALLWTGGCSTTPPGFTEITPSGDPAAAVATAAASNPAARLHEGDVVRINFEGDTNLNTVAKIQLDGTINLQLVGDVKAAGKTVLELQSHLIEKYKPLLKVSELTVNLVSTTASIYVSGAVLRPGRIAMDHPLTALDAIMEAGGFDMTRAKPSAVTVLRMENGQQKHYKLDLKKALRGDVPTPFMLKPFDIIHVPAKTFNY